MASFVLNSQAQLPPPIGGPIGFGGPNSASQLSEMVQLFGGLADTVIGAAGTVSGTGGGNPGITSGLSGLVDGISRSQQPPQPPQPTVPNGVNIPPQPGGVPFGGNNNVGASTGLGQPQGLPQALPPGAVNNNAFGLGSAAVPGNTALVGGVPVGVFSLQQQLFRGNDGRAGVVVMQHQHNPHTTFQHPHHHHHHQHATFQHQIQRNAHGHTMMAQQFVQPQRQPFF